DGIEAVAGNFGPAYPDGIFLAQDGDNAPKSQNVKLVRWDQIAAALGLLKGAEGLR
ncbi:MAG TPA: phytase, partial [Sphingopyxis sp.]|nr:phytase [Sphingopyxis sp.]